MSLRKCFAKCGDEGRHLESKQHLAGAEARQERVWGAKKIFSQIMPRLPIGQARSNAQQGQSQQKCVIVPFSLLDFCAILELKSEEIAGFQCFGNLLHFF